MAPQRPQLPATEQLFEEMPCGLLVTAADGTILRVNSTFCTWVGLPSTDLVDKRKLQDLMTMGARIFHQTHWLPMLQLQGSISEIKFDVKGSGGTPLPMLLNVVRRTTDSGVFDEISAVIATERNQYERELLAARKRADRLVSLEQDRSLFAEQMIGIVSHDLRNPLSVVMLSAKVLTMGEAAVGEAARQSALARIVRAAQRAQRLIDDLLDFTMARVGQGLTVSLKPENLHHIAEKAVEELGLAHPSRVLRHLQSGAGEVVADTHRLAQLLGNLIGNALTHGDATGEVTVTSSVVGNLVKLAVHNTGPAMSPTVLATMFEPMVRGGTPDNATRSVGLGLYIVRAIASAHGGNVAVTSSDEAGTQFVVTFPAQPPA